MLSTFPARVLFSILRGKYFLGLLLGHITQCLFMSLFLSLTGI